MNEKSFGNNNNLKSSITVMKMRTATLEKYKPEGHVFKT
jgi:hypothetical protein